MRAGERTARSGGEERVPRIAPELDLRALKLSPAEGFLLSRIDGRTSWETLRKMGGLPAAEVDRRLEKWLAEGVVELVGRGGVCTVPPKPPPRASATPAAPAAPEPPKASAGPALDESLDLDVEIQKALLAIVGDPRPSYFEILGVAHEADARAIKKAYFAKSKSFHPDRYFRRNVGPFGPLLEKGFKRLLEAYELLSDPATRGEVNQQELNRETARGEEAAASESAAAGDAAAAAALSSIEARRRLRERLGRLSGHRRVVDERKRKAKTFFEAGMAAFAAERWLEAASSVRLAIAFDPNNEVFRERFADVQRQAHEQRAKQLVKQGEAALEMRDYNEALERFEEAFHFRPFDAELAFRAARIALQTSADPRRAKELAASACELEAENASYHRVLGQAYLVAGLKANARRELEAALRLDPKDKEAREALRAT